MKKRFLGYIILYFILLEHLGIGIHSLFIPVGFIFIAAIIVINAQTFISSLNFLYKKTYFKYFMWFYCWAILTLIISICIKTFYLKSFLFSFIGGLTFSVLGTTLATYIILKKYVNTHNFIKFFVAFYFIVFGLGILELIFQQLHGGIPIWIYHLFNNERSLLNIGPNVELFSTQRIQSIFSEPSSLGEFIYLNAPIIYNLSFSKYEIFKNKHQDKIIKKLLLVSMLICFLFVQSPITFVYFLIVTLFANLKRIIKFFVKNREKTVMATMVIMLFCTLFLSINFAKYIEASFLKRISVSVSAFGNLNKLINTEPSLATRIIDNVNALSIAKDFPITGIGYGNITGYIFSVLKKTTLPLTMELWKVLLTQTGSPPYGIFYRLLAETGIIGVFLLYTYFIKLLKGIKKQLNMNKNSIIHDFLEGIYGTILVFITLAAFYNSSLHKTEIFMLIAYILYILQLYYFSKKGGNNGCINNISKL